MAHAASHSTEPEHHEHAHQVMPISTYLIVYGLLMFFLVITYFVSLVNLGPFNLVVALAVAVTKTLLVVLYFMHVKEGTKLTWLWASIGFIWLLLMFGTLGDYITREWIRVPGW